MFWTKPLYLWGLLAISIPVIIHLFFRVKLKPIYFSSLKFLKLSFAKQSFSLKIYNLLLLLLRIALIAALFMFLASPYGYRSVNSQDKIHTLIILDTSYSTHTIYNKSTVLNILKKRIIEKNATRNLLDIMDITRGTIKKNVSPAQLPDILSKIKPSFLKNKLSSALTKLDSYLIKNMKNKLVVEMYSDFQKNEKTFWEKIYTQLLKLSFS
jgi:hypothetical protein